MSWELDEVHRDFQASTRAFVDKQVRPLVDRAEAAGEFPGELWNQLGAAGVLGPATPENLGGAGGDALAVALVAEELARASGGIAVTALVSAYMAGTHVVRFGTPEQQQRWCARIASGGAVAAIAVTEPGTGSDVARVSSTARRTDRGWLLNGREVLLDDVELDADAVIGTEKRGSYQIMEGFQLERIALAAMGIGHAAECLDLARDYAGQWEAFGEPLTHAAISANRIVDDAVQLFGGAGFVEESPVARHYRDVRILRIGGGTDEIQLEILTRGMA